METIYYLFKKKKIWTNCSSYNFEKKNSHNFFFPQNALKSCFPTKDMQTPLLRSAHLYIEDAQCAETNEKSYYRFLFLELAIVQIHWKLGRFEYKNYHKSKIIIGKILNLIFLSIQPIPHLSCKLYHFWKIN